MTRRGAPKGASLRDGSREIYRDSTALGGPGATQFEGSESLASHTRPRISTRFSGFAPIHAARRGALFPGAFEIRLDLLELAALERRVSRTLPTVPISRFIVSVGAS